MWPVSPVALIHEKMQRRHLARLRRRVGVTGLEIPGQRDYPTAALCALGIVAAVVIAVTLW